MINRLKNLGIFKNFYYVLGLAFQKGLPFLTIPFIIWRFGAKNYADFALICYTIQTLSIIATVGAASAVIVFWNNNEDKAIYLGKQLCLVLTTTALFLLISLPIYYFIKPWSSHASLGLGFFILIVIFLIAYNVMGMGIATLRVLFLSKQYFYTVMLSSLVFLAGLFAISFFSRSLISLLFAYVFALILQSFLPFLLTKVIPRFNFNYRDFFRFMRRIFKYSIPIMLYTIITGATVSVDKWIVKLNFSSEVFTQYVLNFQFAYVVNVISVVVNMYSLPIFCQHIAKKDSSALQSNIFENYLLVILVSTFTAVVAWVYAKISGVHLSGGFYILAAAFLFANVYAVNVSLFEAYRLSKRLFLLTIMPNMGFWLVFLLVIFSKNITAAYFDFFIYNFIMFLVTVNIIRPSNKRLLQYSNA